MFLMNQHLGFRVADETSDLSVMVQSWDHCPYFLLLRSFQLGEDMVILNYSGSQAVFIVGQLVMVSNSGQLE